jgi:hypothetical protein
LRRLSANFKDDVNAFVSTFIDPNNANADAIR